MWKKYPNFRPKAIFQIQNWQKKTEEKLKNKKPKVKIFHFVKMLLFTQWKLKPNAEHFFFDQCEWRFFSSKKQSFLLFWKVVHWFSFPFILNTHIVAWFILLHFLIHPMEKFPQKEESGGVFIMKLILVYTKILHFSFSTVFRTPSPTCIFVLFQIFFTSLRPLCLSAACSLFHNPFRFDNNKKKIARSISFE